MEEVEKKWKYFPGITLFAQTFSEVLVSSVYGQNSTKATSTIDLVDKHATTVSSWISAPFQNNMDFRIGPDFGSRFTLNVQPAVPVVLNKKVNFIGRLVLPVINQLK